MYRRQFLRSSALIGTSVVAGVPGFLGAKAQQVGQPSAAARRIIMAGYGAYLLANDMFDDQAANLRPWPALIAAVAYVYAPYFLPKKKPRCTWHRGSPYNIPL